MDSSKTNKGRLALWLGAMALAAIALGAGLGAWYWGSSEPQYKPASGFMSHSDGPPTYEEPMAPSPPAGGLMAIDEAVFVSLHASGIDRGHTSLHLVPGGQGEITEIEARLTPDQKPEAVAASLDEALGSTRANWQWTQVEGGRELLISLASRLTHKVRLLHLRVPLASPVPSPQPPVSGKPRVALIIDDLGYQYQAAKRLLDLELGLTYSVLPFSPHGKKIAAAAAAKGRQVLLHLPMQPRSYPSIDPGPGAIFKNMPSARIERITEADLDSVPGAAGANNHMGSALTEDAAALRPVFKVLGRRGLFFIDSLTSPRSQARSVAREMGLPAASRHIFLDHDPSPKAVRRQVERLIALAGRRDGVIAIAHPHPATIQVLSEMASRISQSLELVPAGDLVKPASRLDSKAQRK